MKKANKNKYTKMDRFLVLERQLIKVEVEGNSNFHCIVCKAEFLSRSERNEHLETHFVHRSCKHCSKPVIVIGDLEFELHQPTYCTKSESIKDDTFVEDNGVVAVNAFDAEIHEDEDMKYENNLNGEESEIEIDIDPPSMIEILPPVIEQPPRNTKRSKVNVNYNENQDEDENEDELGNKSDVKIKRPARKSKRKSGKRNRKNRKTKTEDKPDSHLDVNDETDTESDDEIIKQIGVSIKRSRKDYSKLPKTVPCTLCDSKFATERTLKIHMNKSHGIKERYICPICSREFKISGNLKQHIDTHSDYKRFICNYCGKGFHLPYNLKEHMHTHTGARPYKCETCGKTFGRNTLKQAHMRIHTGEKPYKCTAENCDRKYAYQTDLKRHRRAVHGIITKTFTCPICSKVFYENKFLTKHLNVHQNNI